MKSKIQARWRKDGTAIEEKRRITLRSMRACRLSGDVESKRGEDGRWSPDGYYWNLKRKTRAKLAVAKVDTVNWGGNGPNEFLTLNTLRVLKAVGRFGC